MDGTPHSRHDFARLPSWTSRRLSRGAGGVIGSADLIRLTSRRTVRTAVSRGRIVRVGRGRYALPTAPAALCAAGSLHGTVSHLSAAAFWQWPVKTPPLLPMITLPRGRKLAPERRACVEVRWRALLASDVVEPGVTARVRTVLDCASDLPFDEALAVGDSALREGRVSRAQLLSAAEQMQTCGGGRLSAWHMRPTSEPPTR